MNIPSQAFFLVWYLLSKLDLLARGPQLFPSYHLPGAGISSMQDHAWILTSSWVPVITHLVPYQCLSHSLSPSIYILISGIELALYLQR